MCSKLQWLRQFCTGILGVIQYFSKRPLRCVRLMGVESRVIGLRDRNKLCERDPLERRWTALFLRHLYCRVATSSINWARAEWVNGMPYGGFYSFVSFLL